MIALPIVVLLLEIINLFAKKRAIGVVSFVLLALTVVVAIAAYLTGTTDGKEAFDALTQAGQTDLKAHKILGTYLMLASGVVLVFKLLSSMIQRGLMKALYLLVLILFVVGILKQGKEGGELVYKYGANVERVADLDSDLFDAKEEVEDLQEKSKTALDAAKEKAAEIKEDVSKGVEKAKAKVESAVETVKDKAAEMTAPAAASETSTEAAAETKTEAAPKEEVSKEAPAETAPEVEVVPAAPAETPEVATH